MTGPAIVAVRSLKIPYGTRYYGCVNDDDIGAQFARSVTTVFVSCPRPTIARLPRCSQRCHGVPNTPEASRTVIMWHLKYYSSWERFCFGKHICRLLARLWWCSLPPTAARTHTRHPVLVANCKTGSKIPNSPCKERELSCHSAKV